MLYVLLRCALSFSSKGLELDYGTEQEDTAMSATDDRCEVMTELDFDIPFRGRYYRTIYVGELSICFFPLLWCTSVIVTHAF